MGAIALGVGIWYLSSSLGGSSLTYTSMETFLGTIGAGDDIAAANGCFMCEYITELFATIGRATEMFWNASLNLIWILLAIGFGVFLFMETINHFLKSAQSTTDLDGRDKTLEFKSWFNKIWRQGARVLIVGVLIGAIGMGGTGALKTVANITIRPVMYIGAELAMAASGTAGATHCRAIEQTATDAEDILNPAVAPFMCAMGNLNSVVLAGAAGGFSLMNYAWMGLGGGLFTWIAGLAIVILFLIIGFNLFFKILTVIFKVMFVIIFLPFLLGAAAFEGTWKLAGGITNNVINNMLIKSEFQIISISMQILILYATISYAADEFFPGPTDGYTAIMPPLLGMTPENPDAQTMSVINVFSECERVSLTDGVVDGDRFRECFIARRDEITEKYPHAFDFMSDGWEFMMMIIGLFLLYYYAVAPRVEKIIAAPDPNKDEFNFGAWTKDLGKKIWSAPSQIYSSVLKVIQKN